MTDAFAKRRADDVAHLARHPDMESFEREAEPGEFAPVHAGGPGDRVRVNRHRCLGSCSHPEEGQDGHPGPNWVLIPGGGGAA